MSTDTPTPDESNRPTISRLFGLNATTTVWEILLERGEVTSRYLVDHSGYEPDALQLALSRLEDANVIESITMGHRTSWRLNPRSHVAGAVQDLQAEYQMEVDQ